MRSDLVRREPRRICGRRKHDIENINMMLSKEEIGVAFAANAGAAAVYSTRVLDTVKASPPK
jgi:adenylate kinase